MRARRRLGAILTSFAVILGTAFTAGAPIAYADNSEQTQNMYRMYNKISSEHLYTADVNEREALRRGDWLYEGVGWVAPQQSDTPVYRLYNPYLGDHHYTTNVNEVKALTSKHGWKNEGIKWYSSDSKEVPVWRQYNPRLQVGAHNYTTDSNEYAANNARNGWQGEGVAWYGIAKGWPEADGLPKPSTPTPTTTLQPSTSATTAAPQPSNSATAAQYVLNKNSNIIHPANDQHVKKISEKNKILINSQSDLNYWLNQGARYCKDPY